MISVVTTAFNEEGNILPLYERIKQAMGSMDYEFIAVDDGSSDNTYNELMKIKDRRVTATRLREHSGQCLALYNGLKMASGEIIATIDADLENDPQDIPRMLEELKKGHDCIIGWRHDRTDGLVKRVSSRIGNCMNNAILGMGFHDNTCALKVFKMECVSGMRYFESFHRFLPAMIKLQGFSIKEQRVGHSPRTFGESKYGIRNRIFKNIKAILKVRFRYKELLECP